ncbi:MAG TPA: hypothetical protein VL048_00360 [Xanthobacteraceae bacterium]|nr:hypothetical protein [Xanthobacteraceae bacterium]
MTNYDQLHNRQAPSLKGASLRRSGGRRPAIIGAICVGAAVTLGLTANTTLSWISDVIADQQEQSAHAQDIQIGTVEVQNGQDRCELLKFDNSTGRTINAAVRCHSDEAVDDRGVPIPLGTVHRLDSISKSFLGNGH